MKVNIWKKIARSNK